MANQYKNKVVYNGTTLIDISDTTAVQSDVASGKYFYTANGTKTLGTGSGGSGTGQTTTGTVTGDGTNILEIPCNFAPDLIYVYGDMSDDVANRGIVSLTIIKDVAIYCTNDSSTSNTNEYASVLLHDITGYNESDTSYVHATYSNNTLTIDTVQNSSSARWRSGQVYNYELSTIGTGGGTPSQTQHTVLFEFEDTTTTSIAAYWDGTFISDAIKATVPTSYGGKTVQEASLDGVAWYTKPVGSWETLFDNNANLEAEADAPYPYFWITELSDVTIPQNSVWRITFDGTEYVCTVTRTIESYGYYIGNAAYGAGSDDGTPVPICLYHTPWGAWSGGADASAGSHTLKIERQVLT